MTAPLEIASLIEEFKSEIRSMSSPFMNRKQVAAYFQCDSSTVGKLEAKGKLKRHQVDGLETPLYLRSEVHGLVKERDIQ